MYYVYILRSLADNRHYIGYTKDLERRLEDHKRGKSKSLRQRGPLELIYKEPHETKLEATRRERQIKKFKGGEAFRKLIKTKKDPVV